MKPRRFVLLFVAGLLLVLGTIAAACGDDDGDESDEDAITEVLEEMVTALNDRDFEALAPLITANALLNTEPTPEALQEAFENAETTRGPYPQIEGFKIISVTVAGDEAIANVSRVGFFHQEEAASASETNEEIIILVKRDGRWLIDRIPGL